MPDVGMFMVILEVLEGDTVVMLLIALLLLLNTGNVTSLSKVGEGEEKDLKRGGSLIALYKPKLQVLINKNCKP